MLDSALTCYLLPVLIRTFFHQPFVLYVFHPFGPPIKYSIHLSSTPSSIASSTMAGPVIRPFFATLEKGLDLNPLLGELVSNKLVSQNKMKELNEMKSTKQNRAFLMYLCNQPVEQLKCFCHILLQDVGNAFHQKIATQIRVAISGDPWKRLSDLLLSIASQLTHSADACALKYRALEQTMDQYQMYFPQQPQIFLIHLLLAMEVIAAVTDVTAVRGEILRIYQSLDW